MASPRRAFGLVAALLFSTAMPAADAIDQRVSDLLARMSVEEPGERRTVTFELVVDHLGWYDAEGHRHLDPGEVELRVGTSAEHLPLKATVRVREPAARTGFEH